MANVFILGLMKFLHDLFTVLWIGGMLVLGIIVLPSLRSTFGNGPDLKKVTDSIRRRLSKVAFISIVGLFLTGILMSNSSPSFTGYLSLANTYSLLLAVKHILVGIMVVIAVVRNRLLSKMQPEGMGSQEKRGALLLIINMILGVAVLALSGFTAAISTIASIPS